MEAKNKLINQTQISEAYLRTHKIDSTETRNGYLTPAATEKQKLNQKYAYLLYAAAEEYNQLIEQEIKAGRITPTPGLEDNLSYWIRTGWHDLLHDKVFNMYISDMIIGMRVYNIFSWRILQNITAWYLATNNTHLLNQDHYYNQFIMLLFKYTNIKRTVINNDLLRQILNHQEKKIIC